MTVGDKGREVPLAIPLVLAGLALLPGASSAATTTRFVQAEGAVLNGACTLGTDHAGFTGTSFVNCPDDAISTIEWTGVRAQAAGTKRLKFRFANGSGTNRASELVVNGVVESGNLAFAPTGAWTTWTFATIDAALDAGDNTVQLRGTVAGQGLANIDRMDVSEISEVAPDWGIAVVESTMLRRPTPSSLGGWSYANAFHLLGMHRTYQRVGDPRYLQYLEAWVDSLVGSQGNLYDEQLPIQRPHSRRPRPHHARQAHPRRLRRATQDELSDRAPDPPQPLLRGVEQLGRTTDLEQRVPTHQRRRLLPRREQAGGARLDGAFMGQTFLHRYGQKFGGVDEVYADDEGTQQIIIQFGHLKDAVSGLLWHAYDEERDASWPFAPGTSHSQEFWCRAMGWYGMAIVEVLDVLDPDHPNRPQLDLHPAGSGRGLGRLPGPGQRTLVPARRQGFESGKLDETSCSAMYSYTISRAVQGGFVDTGYATVATDGFDGVLEKISFGANAMLAADLPDVTDICKAPASATRPTTSTAIVP